MNTTYPIAAIGELIGDPARASILIALLDGSARPAGELAFIANISAPSASGHLSKLVDGGLLTVRNNGRHRYYSLAGVEVAHALEALGSIATKPRPATQSSAPQNRPRVGPDMYTARSCYDHLAGAVAVELAGQLQKSKVIKPSANRDYEVTRDGRAWFAEFGINVDRLRHSRRVFARQCLDWTERRPHIAGALGAALFERLVDLDWLAPRKDTRAVRVTLKGEREFHRRFGLKFKAA